MANITQEVHFEMLEKLPDGNFKAKFPKVKSKSGITFDELVTEYESLKVKSFFVNTSAVIPANTTGELIVPLGKIPKKYIHMTHFLNPISWGYLYSDLNKYKLEADPNPPRSFGETVSIQPVLSDNMIALIRIDLIADYLKLTYRNYSTTASKTVGFHASLEVV